MCALELRAFLRKLELECRVAEQGRVSFVRVRVRWLDLVR
jgi:hypothetical protein